VSLLVNVSLVGYGTYVKKDVINTKIENIKYTMFYSKYESKDSLSTMNNTSEPNEVTENINVTGSKDTFKILIIGNSISYHPIAPNIGWDHAGGMGASSKDNDYAHVLLKDISNKYHTKNIEMKIVNLTEFERNFSAFDFSKVDKYREYNSDVIIFQLGENVILTNNFTEKYRELINKIKGTNKPLVICASPFMPSLEKNKAVKEVCINTNSLFVDLSHLTLLDKSNYAYTEHDYSKGVGNHPGDKGMSNIAKELFIPINNSLY